MLVKLIGNFKLTIGVDVRMNSCLSKWPCDKLVTHFADLTAGIYAPFDSYDSILRIKAC